MPFRAKEDEDDAEGQSGRGVGSQCLPVKILYGMFMRICSECKVDISVTGNKHGHAAATTAVCRSSPFIDTPCWHRELGSGNKETPECFGFGNKLTFHAKLTTEDEFCFFWKNSCL